tara:strand:- start:127 stop:1788 length:1662 start_codon:yes stop_codon:yes gene_type:complete
MIRTLVLLLFFNLSYSQNYDLNSSFLEKYIRYNNLNGSEKIDYTFTIRPLNEVNKIYSSSKNLFKNKKETIRIELLPIYFGSEYNSIIPYNRNNGSLIPNRGIQYILSPGFFIKTGPLEIKIQPEYVYSENKDFQGFWENHDPLVWARRYLLWNSIDMPEKHGSKSHSKFLSGQSSIKLKWKNISLGLSSENLWWGPSIRNSIMMSNHAQGFPHISLNSIKPHKTKIGNFEWQLISGKLEQSGFLPSNSDYEYQGTKLFVPKSNQNGNRKDWRYLQALIVTYSPSFIDGLSIGFIRWAQMYSELVKGEMWWFEGKTSYFPVFNNLFRKNDRYVDYEEQINQAAGIFLRWVWKDAKAEIYSEFHHNDSKQNFRDLILDSDHSRAATLGLMKIFSINNKEILFNWEWTQMEQNASRIVRNASSWYRHRYVRDGYTNKGEVLGSSIGPGSNSHYFSLSKLDKKNYYGIALELVEHDNDFYYNAFAVTKDFRRYWKDFNFQLNYERKIKNIWISTNFIFSKNLNYKWGLEDDAASPYYRPGIDIDNFHSTIKLRYSL